MKNFIARIMMAILKIIHWLLVIFILLTVLGMVAPYLDNIHSFSFLQRAIAFESAINQTITYYIPTKLAGYDLSRVLTLIVLLLLFEQITTMFENIKFSVQKRKMAKDFKNIQQTIKSPKQKEKIALLENKMTQASTASGKHRQELLKEFARIKKELEKTEDNKD
jgi:hypothetical protein